MKRILAILLALCAILSLAACGGNTASGGSAPAGGTQTASAAPAAPAKPEDVTGETYDTGTFQALVPTGWKAFAVPDVFADEDDAMDPDNLRIIKGGETDMDVFSKPYIQLSFYGEDTSLWTPSKDFYDEGEDLEPITVGGMEWKGFKAKSLGDAIIILWTEGETIQYQASIFPEASKGTISLEDADVLAILASVQPR